MGKGGLLRVFGWGQKPILTLEQFRRRVAEFLLSLQPGAKLDFVGEDEIAYAAGGSLNVSNGYAYYLEHPRELRHAVRRLAQLALDQPSSTKAEDLIILVRPASFQAGKDGEADRGLARPLAAGLIAVVAVDMPESYVLSRASELRRDLAMDDAQIWDRAAANLRERLDMTPPRFESGKILGIKTDIGLAASFLVADCFWEHPNLSSLGQLVVAPLERDELVVAPLSEPDLVRALRNIVSRRESAEFLCDRLLVRRNGGWEEFS
jgi:hypothetical protein